MFTDYYPYTWKQNWPRSDWIVFKTFRYRSLLNDISFLRDDVLIVIADMEIILLTSAWRIPMSPEYVPFSFCAPKS